MYTSLTEFYSVNEASISKALLRFNPQKVLVQLPEGLKHFYPSVLRILERISDRLGLTDIEFHIDASPIYGSCLMDLSLTSRHDLVLHFGHKEYPFWSPPSNVVLVDLKYRRTPSKDTLLGLKQELKREGIRRIGIYGTAQHDVARIGNELRHLGLEIINDMSHSTIFGCWYSDLPVLTKAEGVIIVAGGEFHAIGAGLASGGRIRVYSLDPYTESFRDFTPLIEKVLKHRYYTIMKAADAYSFVILAGVGGQYRQSLISKLKHLIKVKGLKYSLAEAPYATKETLGNMDNPEVDSFIITSCPRLPIDDLSDYYKPVLTPGEARMVLENLRGRYIYPW